MTEQKWIELFLLPEINYLLCFYLLLSLITNFYVWKNSDGGILEQSVMGRKLEAGALNIPNDKNLPEQNVRTPYVIIGDEAKRYLMRPFPNRQA
jgi:hypothetical protein